MSNVTKSPSVNNYKNVSSSHVSKTKSSSQVPHINGKGENHNNPNHASGNERYIIDAFYSNAHNLKASYNRLSNASGDKESLRQYYRLHEEEAYAGASDLVQSINDLLETSSICDNEYITHFKFLVESILNDFENDLIQIGITHKNYHFTVNRYTFFNKLCDKPEVFEFLFRTPFGLIEMLSKVYYKIQNITGSEISEGRIIDYRT